MTRFRLRSLMILVALVVVGIGVAITMSRIRAAVSMLQSESGAVLAPACAILVQAVITALFPDRHRRHRPGSPPPACVAGLIPGSGRTRPDRLDNQVRLFGISLYLLESRNRAFSEPLSLKLGLPSIRPEYRTERRPEINIPEP